MMDREELKKKLSSSGPVKLKKAVCYEKRHRLKILVLITIFDKGLLIEVY